MGIVLYGIPNCDQVRKARAWLDANGIGHAFHDFKKAGIDRTLAEAWLKDLPWDVLVNRKGTTWRSLPDERKAAITGADAALQLMLESPSVIKRPILSTGSATHCGFSAELYQRVFTR